MDVFLRPCWYAATSLFLVLCPSFSVQDSHWLPIIPSQDICALVGNLEAKCLAGASRKQLMEVSGAVLIEIEMTIKLMMQGKVQINITFWPHLLLHACKVL